MFFPTKLLVTISLIFSFYQIAAQSVESIVLDKPVKDLRVGFAGTEPFVIHKNDKIKGISVEIWDLAAQEMGINYTSKSYTNVSDAINDLKNGTVDVLVGSTSITADRAEMVEFSQPYFQSSLGIMSRANSPTFYERIAGLFTINLLYALFIFLFILACIGTLLWLAERKASPKQFPNEPIKGIANGMWCAIVTMSTTGYGDIAPVTLLGRIVAGTWMIVSILFATTMVAGIASSLTLSALGKNTISSAEQFQSKKIAVLNDEMAIDFVEKFNGNVVLVANLAEAHKLLKNNEVQAIVFDKTQLKYFLKMYPDKSSVIATTAYLKQEYGFAFPLNSTIVSDFNIELLKLKENGVFKKIMIDWLGEEEHME